MTLVLHPLSPISQDSRLLTASRCGQQAQLATLDHAIIAVSKTHITSVDNGKKFGDLALKRKLINDRNIFQHLLQAKTLSGYVAKDIQIGIQYCLYCVEDKTPSEEEINNIRLFFDKLSQLDKGKFDRHALLGGKVALQRVLSEELNQLMLQEEENPSVKESTTHQLNVAIAKAKLAISLGHGNEAAKNGVNGTILVKDLENKYVGVFKAPPEIKWYHFRAHIKNYFGQARLLNQQDQLGQQFAEVAAHKFDRIMGFKLAPAATMAQINGKEGAFLAFLNGYQELKDVEASLQSRKTFSEHETKIWQMMCVYNYLIGNMDPHNQNIFVKLDEAGMLSEFRVIDHGNSFIDKNPGAWGSKGNQGTWGHYTISKEAFSPEIREFILNQLTEDKLEEFIKEIGQQRTEFWSQGMDQYQRQRLILLRECVGSGKIASPADLAAIHSREDYTKHLKDVQPAQPTKAWKSEDGFVVVDF